MSNKKQTAVELLKQDLDLEMKLGTKMVVNWDMYLEMEKKQIIEAYIASDDIPIDTELYRTLQNNDAEQYYKETYRNKKIDKEEQKKLITEIMDEDVKNGLYNTSLQTELSDEEILKEASKSAINYSTKRTYPEIRHLAYSNGFLEGIKWYREQLKKK